MAFFDRLGKVAFDTLDTVPRAAEKARETAKKRVNPIIDKSELASRVRDRVRQRTATDDDFEVPMPEQNVSPFAPPPEHQQPARDLADPGKAAQVYGRGTDPWTERAVRLLVDRRIEHEFVDLEAEGGLQLDSQLVRETKQDKAPYVYLRGEFIGGFNALHEIERLGQLEEMIKPADQRDKSRIRVVIPKRGGDVVPGEQGNPDDRK